jgi:PspA-Associated protein
VIVRIMGEGQWRVDDDEIAELDTLDTEAGKLLEAGDEEGLRRVLGQMADRVRSNGEQLPDADLHPSDAIVPPTDLSLDEARQLFEGEGLIPDLPT